MYTTKKQHFILQSISAPNPTSLKKTYVLKFRWQAKDNILKRNMFNMAMDLKTSRGIFSKESYKNPFKKKPKVIH